MGGVHAFDDGVGSFQHRYDSQMDKFCSHMIGIESIRGVGYLNPCDVLDPAI
jgi:hypothetical protein